MSRSWRTVTLLGREMFTLDWLDFLGIGTVVLAIVLGVLIRAMR